MHKGFVLKHELYQRRAMLDGQILPNRVTSKKIISAMGEIARENYVPSSYQDVAYTDATLPLGHGRYMLEPMVFARLVEAADIASSDVILDVACGTGYSSAVLSKLGEVVVGLECLDDFVVQANKNLEGQGADNAVVLKGKLAEGVKKQGPFDVIFINGGVEVLPIKLIEQLAEGGRLVTIYVEDGVGHGYQLTRVNGEVCGHNLFDAQAPVLPEFSKLKDFAF